MKPTFKFDNKNFIAEVSISNMMEEDETDLHDSYMSECMMNEAMFVNTAGMSTSDAKYMCGMSYMKNRQMLMKGGGELTDEQKTLPDKIKLSILKRYEKSGKLSEEGKKQLQSMAAAPKMEEMKAEPTAVFVQEPAPPSGDITPNAAEEGVKIDDKLKKQEEKDALKNPDLQSPTFNPAQA